ncbi:membrane protein [Mycobacterium phage Superchunk]|nr:membrane protein [Mycobacterium phage Superchunk]
MKKTIAAVIIGIAAIMSLSACEGGTGSSDYTPSVPVFIPMPGTPGLGIPVMI